MSRDAGGVALLSGVTPRYVGTRQGPIARRAVMGISQPSGDEQDNNDDEKNPANSGRPPAVGVISPVGESAEDEEEEKNE